MTNTSDIGPESKIPGTQPEEPQGLTTADLAKTPSGERRPDEIRTFEESAEDRGDAERLGAEASADRSTPLFATGEAEELRRQWDAIQGGFVDEPRKAVERADELVAQAMQRLAEMFADERGQLEGQWDRGGDVSTEDLRVALQRYRSFFDRLLSV